MTGLASGLRRAAVQLPWSSQIARSSRKRRMRREPKLSASALCAASRRWEIALVSASASLGMARTRGQHVQIAGGAKEARDPFEFTLQMRELRITDQRREEAEGSTQAANGDARLMNALNICRRCKCCLVEHEIMEAGAGAMARKAASAVISGLSARTLAVMGMPHSPRARRKPRSALLMKDRCSGACSASRRARAVNHQFCPASARAPLRKSAAPHRSFNLPASTGDLDTDVPWVTFAMLRSTVEVKRVARAA